MIVQVERHVAGALDAHGNSTDSWSAPESLPAFGWAPSSTSEPKTVGADRVVVALELFAPWALDHRDRVTVAGKVYEVEGETEDWIHGPFGFAPGFVINLRRVDG